MKKTVFFVLLVLISTAGSYAQVTIGSDIKPTRAALLDIKAKQTAGAVPSVTDDANTTVGEGDGGLLLPRVKLVKLNTLEPFIPVTDPDYTANTNSLKEKLAGLMVYNLTNDGTFYPGFYVWDGEKWGTAQINEAASSIVSQPEAFSFYEQGTETALPLTFSVNGSGTWTYQWYQVTGSNVHVRIGTPVGQSGTVSGTGATTASFIPTGVLKGTTRNSNNTGFYKFYCVATSSKGVTLTSNTAEVAVGCGAKNNAGEWISFLCFNLGATDMTIDAQKNHSMNPVNAANGSHYYIAGEENFYGDLYQWGRIGDGHEKRGAAQGFIVGQTTAGTNQAAYGTGPTYEDGNLIGTSQRYPFRQVARTDATHYGKFITTAVAQGYNWAFGVGASIDQLWRSGRFDANDPCAKIKEDGLTYETYYPATGGISGSNTNWRTPSQEEWGSIYKGGSISGSIGTATANTWTWNGSNGGGYEISPDGVTTTLFLPATGSRSGVNGVLAYQSTGGYYWSSSISNTLSYYMSFSSGSNSAFNPAGIGNRANGYALRCIKN